VTIALPARAFAKAATHARLAAAARTLDAVLASCPKSGRTRFRYVPGLEFELTLQSQFAPPQLRFRSRAGLPAMISYLNGWASGLPRHRHLILRYGKLSADPASSGTDVIRFLAGSVA
jgi:hypothetical protein